MVTGCNKSVRTPLLPAPKRLFCFDQIYDAADNIDSDIEMHQQSIVTDSLMHLGLFSGEKNVNQQHSSLKIQRQNGAQEKPIRL